MDSTHVSPEIMFLFEGNETISFSSSSLSASQKPDENQLRKKVIGVQLAYADCGEHHGGIEPMARAFGAYPDGIITEVPKTLTLDTQNDVTILKYGSAVPHRRILEIAKEVGVAGYWDDANLIICASNKYESIIKHVKDFIQPQKAKFAFRTVFGGRNLMILSV